MWGEGEGQRLWPGQKVTVGDLMGRLGYEAKTNVSYLLEGLK